MSSKTCIDLRELQQGHGFGAVSMHSLQPQLHLQVLLSPQICPRFLPLSAQRYRTGSGTGQCLPAALCWQLCLPISLSQLLKRFKKVFFASSDWTESTFHEMGVSAQKAACRGVLSSHWNQQLTLLLYQTKAPGCFRDNCKSAFLGWGIKSRHSCPTTSS